MAWIPAAASAAGSVVADVANLFGQSAANRQSQNWQQSMYQQQRKDALADWNMQNQYNSPAAQMQRYKDAGLNPNLVYGSAGSGAAGAVRSSSPGSFSAQPYKFSSPQSVGNIPLLAQQMKQTDSQINATDAQAKSAAQDATNKAIEAKKLGQDVAFNDIRLGYAPEMAKSQLSALQANIDKTLADTYVNLSQNERAAALQAPTVEAAFQNLVTIRLNQMQKQADIMKTGYEADRIRQDISNMRIQADNMLKSGVLQQQEIDLRRDKGLSWSDDVKVRLAAKAADFVGLGNSGSVRESLKGLRDMTGDILNPFSIRNVTGSGQTLSQGPGDSWNFNK